MCQKTGEDKVKPVETNRNARIKSMIKNAVEGKFTTILMAIVTLFALVGVSITYFTVTFNLNCLGRHPPGLNFQVSRHLFHSRPHDLPDSIHP